MPIIYDELAVKASLIIAKKGNFYGVVTDLNIPFIPFEFEHIDLKWQGIIVLKDGKKGMYSFDGAFILPAKYDEIKVSSYPQISVKENDRWNSYLISELTKKQ